MSGSATIVQARPVNLSAILSELSSLSLTLPKSSGGKRGKPMNPHKVAILHALTQAIRANPTEGNIAFSPADFAGFVVPKDNETDMQYDERLTKEVTLLVRNALDQVTPRGEIVDPETGKVRPAPRESDIIPPVFPTFYTADGSVISRNVETGESYADYANRARSYPGFRRQDGYFGSIGNNPEMVLCVWKSQ